MDASAPPTPRNIRDLRNIPLAELAARSAQARAENAGVAFNSAV